MKKILLFVVVMVISVSAIFAQTSANQKATAGVTLKKIDKTDVWFVAFKVTDLGFPTEAFSVSNADYFITAVQGWITVDNQRYTNKIAGTNGDFILIKRSEYYAMPAAKQEQLKNWVKTINRLFTMEDSYQIDDIKRYLLSQSDYNSLQSILN